jgi:hypothetical protein
MVFVIGTIEVLAIPTTIVLLARYRRTRFDFYQSVRWVKDIRTYSTQAGYGGESLIVKLRIRTRRSIISAKVWTGVATETTLGSVVTRSPHRITYEHAETLHEFVSILPHTGPDVKCLTGLNAVTVFFLGAI